MNVASLIKVATAALVILAIGCTKSTSRRPPSQVRAILKSVLLGLQQYSERNDCLPYSSRGAGAALYLAREFISEPSISFNNNACWIRLNVGEDGAVGVFYANMRSCAHNDDIVLVAARDPLNRTIVAGLGNHVIISLSEVSSPPVAEMVGKYITNNGLMFSHRSDYVAWAKLYDDIGAYSAIKDEDRILGYVGNLGQCEYIYNGGRICSRISKIGGISKAERLVYDEHGIIVELVEEMR